MAEIRRTPTLGQKGEYLAKCYLEEKGMEFIKSNFLAKHGEIDLIMKDQNEIVFVEVKTRTLHSAMQYGRGTDKINEEKIFHLNSAIHEFLHTEKRVSEGLIPRNDVVEIYIDTDTDKIIVNHIKSAY